MFCERFTDLLSVLFLISFGLFSAIQGQWAIATVGLAQLIIVLILQRPNLLKKRIIKPLGRWSRLRAIIRKIEALIDSISTLLDPKILVGSVLLGSLSWVFEGIALYWLFQCLGAEAISLYQAVMILAASDLIGAISFLPGGIGGAEATIISLSIFYGAGQTEAITATFLIRFLTLWFGVWLGILAMLSEQNISEGKAQR